MRIPIYHTRAFLLAASAFASVAPRADASEPKAAPTKAPALKIVALKVLPGTLELENLRDVRRLVVSGQGADGYWHDLTFKADYKPAMPAIKRDKEGFFHAAKPGKTTLAVTYQGLATSIPVTVKTVAD